MVVCNEATLAGTERAVLSKLYVRSNVQLTGGDGNVCTGHQLQTMCSNT
jgi:hypothetical protein